MSVYEKGYVLRLYLTECNDCPAIEDRDVDKALAETLAVWERFGWAADGGMRPFDPDEAPESEEERSHE